MSKRFKYKRETRIKVEITKGRLKGETGMAIGDTCLNMDYRVIVFRDNPRARDKILGFSPGALKEVKP